MLLVMIRISKVFNGIGKAIVLSVVITLINCIILVASFILPTEKMRAHVAESVPLINSEEMYLRWDWGYNTTQVDGQSEYDLYGMAINEDAPGNIIERAMFMWYPDGENLPRNEAVAAYARKDDVHFDLRPYTRYWNGSVIFIKLLLLKFTIQDIRMINFFVQMSLLLVIIWLMARQGMDRFIVPFIAGILFINPFTMALSVKYAAEYIPMLLCILTIVMFGDRIEKRLCGWELLFAITGSVTAFMCMLSFPGITLGMPLLVLLWRNKEQKASLTVIKLSAYWGVAYAITWSMKWIIGTMSTSYNFLEDAFNQMFKYQGDNTAVASPMERLIHTLWCIYNPVYVLLFLGLGVIAVVLYVKISKEEDTGITSDGGNTLDKLIAYGIIAIIPMVIILGLGNGYAYVHAYMAHRHYAISVTAGICILELLVATVFNKMRKKS